MRWLGVDPGAARVGLAICDPEERIAVPLEVIPASVAFPAIRTIVTRDGVQGVVLGLARTPRGEEGESALRARRLGDRITRVLGLPVEYEDEALTSVAADRIAVAHGGSNGPHDDIAATLILQQFLDGRHPEHHAAR